MIILIFWNKAPPKGYSKSNTEKLNTAIEFCKFELVLVPNFSLNSQFCFFLTRFAQNRNSEHHHWILLIQIKLCTKFQLKLTILIFSTKRKIALPCALPTVLNVSEQGPTNTTTFNLSSLSSRRDTNRPIRFCIWLNYIKHILRILYGEEEYCRSF